MGDTNAHIGELPSVQLPNSLDPASGLDDPDCLDLDMTSGTDPAIIHTRKTTRPNAKPEGRNLMGILNSLELAVLNGLTEPAEPTYNTGNGTVVDLFITSYPLLHNHWSRKITYEQIQTEVDSPSDHSWVTTSFAMPWKIDYIPHLQQKTQPTHKKSWAGTRRPKYLRHLNPTKHAAFTHDCAKHLLSWDPTLHSYSDFVEHYTELWDNHLKKHTSNKKRLPVLWNVDRQIEKLRKEKAGLTPPGKPSASRTQNNQGSPTPALQKSEKISKRSSKRVKKPSEIGWSGT
jgi:hypothetical protein